MKKASQAIKVESLDYAPKFKDCGPDKILAAGGILTMKNKDFVETLDKIDEKTLKGFHNESTRRAHASLTTSANLYFWIEGSRLIDFYFTSFPFGSYMMLSVRKFEVTPEIIIIPDAIANSKFKEEYENMCKRLVDLYKRVKDETKGFDKARRLLPMGISSQGFFNFPLQVVLGIINEVKEDKDREIHVIPKEIERIAEIFEDQIKNSMGYLADASFKLPYNINFTHPNLFKSDIKLEQSENKILLKDENLGKMINDLKNKLKVSTSDPKENIKRKSSIWKEFIDNVQDKILLEAKLKSSLSAWNDLKRHRTVRQKVESIYHAADRCIEKWDESNFNIPDVENPETKREIINAFRESLDFYKKMIDNGIEKRDAIYVIPNGMIVGVKMLFDGYHIFDPFGFVGIRSCTTADPEIVLFVNRIVHEVKKELPEAEGVLGPKCKLGFCPERSFCGVVKQFVRNYDENLHSNFN